MTYQQHGPHEARTYLDDTRTVRLRRPAAAQPGLRATDRDREAAAEVLHEAYATGRLGDAEHSARLSQVLVAPTYAELDALTADLPARPRYPDAPPGPRRTNGFAIASLACGVAQPLTFMLTTIPAVVFGHIARRQIRERGENGKSMATWGLILGWGGVTAAVTLVLLIIAGAVLLARMV